MTDKQKDTTLEQIHTFNDSFNLFFENMESTINRLSSKEELHDSLSKRAIIMDEFEQTTKNNNSIGSLYIGIQKQGIPFFILKQN